MEYPEFAKSGDYTVSYRVGKDLVVATTHKKEMTLNT